jgi:hypothetical protein
MKGMSLAIETIVFVILAVTVLSVLLAFFMTTGVPGGDKARMYAEMNELCGKYVRQKPLCNDASGLVDVDTTRLIKICQSLGTDVKNGAKQCTTGFDKNCAAACCDMFC